MFSLYTVHPAPACSLVLSPLTKQAIMLDCSVPKGTSIFSIPEGSRLKLELSNGSNYDGILNQHK